MQGRTPMYAGEAGAVLRFDAATSSTAAAGVSIGSMPAELIVDVTSSNTSAWPSTYEPSQQCAPDDYEPFCRFGIAYASYHGYVGTTVCLAGFAMNLLNTVILSRSQLLCPTNIILISISVADMVTIGVFMPYLIFFVLDEGTGRYTRGVAFARYTLIFAHAGLVSHTASAWFTVTLAAFRCLCVIVRGGAGRCTYRRVWFAIGAVSAASTLLAAPQYAYLHVQQAPNGDWYVSDQRPAGSSGGDEGARLDRTLHDVQLWCVAVLGKMAPCATLAVLSTLLIRTMAASREAMRKWENKSALRTYGNGVKTAQGQQRPHSEKQARRTTAMLVAVVVLFGIVETPQALLLFLSQILGQRFYDGVYQPLGNLIDLLTIFNSSANFVIYCTMSKQFRAVAGALLLRSLGRASAQLPLRTSTAGDEPAIETASTSRGPASGGSAQLPHTQPEHLC